VYLEFEVPHMQQRVEVDVQFGEVLLRAATCPV